LFADLPARPSSQQKDQHPYLLIAGMIRPLCSNKYTHVSHLQKINFALLTNGDRVLEFKIPPLLESYNIPNHQM
jgi:hypothetical protein